MPKKENRKELVMEFFETLTALHRLIGESNSPQPQTGERRRTERRQPQTELMYILSRKRELTIKKIAAAMRITSSAATQMVENLVGQGLVVRLDDPYDRRVVRVRLSPKGKAEFERFKNKHLSRLSIVLKNLTDQELRVLIQVRQKILGSAI